MTSRQCELFGRDSADPHHVAPLSARREARPPTSEQRATQRSVLDYVIDFAATEGRPPSISEVADEYGWTRPKAQRSIDATIRAGFLARSEDRARTLHVTELGWRDRARRESSRRGEDISPATCRVCVVAQPHLAKLEPLERQTALAFLAQPLRGLTVPA